MGRRGKWVDSAGDFIANDTRVTCHGERGQLFF